MILLSCLFIFCCMPKRQIVICLKLLYTHYGVSRLCSRMQQQSDILSFACDYVPVAGEVILLQSELQHQVGFHAFLVLETIDKSRPLQSDLADTCKWSFCFLFLCVRQLFRRNYIELSEQLFLVL